MDKYKYSKGDVRKVYDAGYNDGRYEKDYDPLSHYLVCDVIEHVETPRSIETPCIRDMCCNQFGERDEMQSIINSLQADVIARGARITDLEREVERLQQARKELEALKLCVSRDE